MKISLNMVGIVAGKFDQMVSFYKNTLGMEIIQLVENRYCEFKHDGTRFAITTNDVMHGLTKHKSYQETTRGQRLELAFLVDTPADVDTSYSELITKGATAVTPPADMPWGQRAAFFADPDGNIHEVFANLT